jgi:hypothetical protein
MSQKNAVPASMSELPSLAQSTISIPVKISAKPFLDNLKARIPPEYVSTGWPGFLATGCDFRYKYRFVTSALRFTCVNNLVSVTMSGSYQIAGSKSICAFGKQISPWLSGSCGFSPEIMRRIEVSLQSQISFQPDYSMRTLSRVSAITPIDRCRMTILSTDVTGMITDQIRSAIAEFATSFDRNMVKTNLSPFLGKAGADINLKRPLGNYGFISVHPSEITLSSINYSKDTIYLKAGVTCFPEISSDSINKGGSSTLPVLKPGDMEPGFTINANAAYEYRFITAMLNRLAKNKSIKLNGNTLMVRNLEVTGLENNLVLLRVEFTGSRSGVIYLKGTPILDVARQEISVPDLTYDLRSGDLLMNMGATFFKKKAISAIRRKAVLNIDVLYQQNKSRIDSALNRVYPKHVSTNGATSEMKVTGLVVKKDTLLFQVHVKGRMDVVVGSLNRDL